MITMVDNNIYMGTYPVRRIAKAEQGIHMPTGITGYFSIYKNEDSGVLTLIPQGEKPEKGAF